MGPAARGLDGAAVTDDLATMPVRYSRPGHDRDCLRAMYAQAGHGRALSQVQVEHLLKIAWLAGAHAEHDAIHDGITEDAREIFEFARSAAQAGYSGNRLIDTIAYVYGPSLPWRHRVRLAFYLAFRKGYSR